MLNLQSDRWSTLECRSGPANLIQNELMQLYANPDDKEKITDLWPYLSSEGTTWSAAYAAAPHLLELAKRTSGRTRFEYLFALSLFRINEDQTTHSLRCEEDLREPYENALRGAITLLVNLAEMDFAEDSIYFLSALASLKGMPKLADFLQHITEEVECFYCGEPLLVKEGH